VSGRRVALAIAAGRVALGLGALLATERTLTVLGFEPSDAGARTLTRLLGGRDLALAGVTLAARDDPSALGRLTFAGVALDAADAISSGIAARDPDARPGAVGSAASGVAAALAGVWAWRRIR
jgi:hypothetical protein